MKPLFYNVLLLAFVTPTAMFAGPLHEFTEIGDINDLQAYVSSLPPEKLKAQLAETDEQGATPLHRAVFEGKLEFVAYLVKVGANREALWRKETPLELAQRRGQIASSPENREKWALIVIALDFHPEERPDYEEGDMLFPGDSEALRMAAGAAAQALGRVSPSGRSGSW